MAWLTAAGSEGSRRQRSDAGGAAPVGEEAAYDDELSSEGRGRNLTARNRQRRPSLPFERLPGTRARADSAERQHRDQDNEPSSHAMRARGLEPLRGLRPNGT